MLKYLLLGISLILIFANMLTADSLWKKTNESLFSAPKSKRIGDLITIYISVNSSAIQEAGTNTSKQSSIGTNLVDSWDQVAQLLGTNENIRRNKSLKVSGEDKYDGNGKTSRKSKVDAVITAVITEISDNGTMYIVGDHNVKVNDEIETIHIAGLIRPEDITQENTVFSYQIARAEVSVKGIGVVASKQTPGILTKLFNWLF